MSTHASNPMEDLRDVFFRQKAFFSRVLSELAGERGAWVVLKSLGGFLVVVSLVRLATWPQDIQFWAPLWRLIETEYLAGVLSLYFSGKTIWLFWQIVTSFLGLILFTAMLFLALSAQSGWSCRVSYIQVLVVSAYLYWWLLLGLALGPIASALLGAVIVFLVARTLSKHLYPNIGTFKIFSYALFFQFFLWPLGLSLS